MATHQRNRDAEDDYVRDEICDAECDIYNHGSGAVGLEFISRTPDGPDVQSALEQARKEKPDCPHGDQHNEPHKHGVGGSLG